MIVEEMVDLLNELFTNTSDLKKLIDITASKWGLQIEENIYVQDNEYIQDGYIIDRCTKMLVFKQHIFCNVMPNKCGITSIHLIHDSQEDTIACQAYKSQKPMLNHCFFSKRSKQPMNLGIILIWLLADSLGRALFKGMVAYCASVQRMIYLMKQPK